MTRRQLTVNRAPRAPRGTRFTPPRCESSKPGPGALRCLFDTGHHPKHFASGFEWTDAEAAA